MKPVADKDAAAKLTDAVKPVELTVKSFESSLCMNEEIARVQSKVDAASAAAGVSMSFKIDAGDLLKKLEPAMLVGAKGALREAEYERQISLRVHEGKVVAEANNGIIFIQTDLGAVSGGSEGGIVLPTAELAAGLRSFDNGLVDLEVVDPMPGVGVPVLHVRQGGDASFVLPVTRGCVRADVPLPFNAENVVIDRKELLGASRVAGAAGIRKYRPEFFQWVLRIGPGGYRALAGDGSRFEVLEREGQHLVAAASPTSLLLHRDHTPLLKRLLKMIDAPEISVTQWSIDGQPFTRVEGGGHRIDLLGNTPAKWPDENKFLGRSNPVRIITRLADWRLPIQAVMATYTSEIKNANKIHTAKLLIDTAKRLVTVTAGDRVTVSRTVPIMDADVKPGAPAQFTFPCVSQYLQDLVKRGNGSEFVELGFVDDRAPVIVRYIYDGMITDDYWHHDANAVKERFTMFFASFNK